MTTAYDHNPAMEPNQTTEVGRNFDAFQKTYEQVAWVYMACSVKAENAAQVPLIVHEKGNPQNLFPNHLLHTIFGCPNPNEVGTNFIATTMIFMELTGNCYWEIVRDFFGVPRSLYLLNAARIEPVIDPVIGIKGYKWKTLDGEETLLPPDRVLHLKYANPNNQFIGVGRIAAARMGVTLDLLTEKYNKAFFDNNAVPAALLVPEEPLTPRQLNRVKRMLQREFQGVHRQHGVGILGANLKLEKVGISPKDIEFLEQQKFSRDKIGSMFHVPPIYMGNFSEASYANSEAQRKLFWEVTIIPWLQWLLQNINKGFVPLVDPEVTISLDRGYVIPLIESLSTLTKSLMDLRNGGYVTANEGRTWLGLPPSDDPSADTLFIPAQFVPEEDQLDDDDDEETPEDFPSPEEETPEEDEEVAPEEEEMITRLQNLGITNGTFKRMRNATQIPR